MSSRKQAPAHPVEEELLRVCDGELSDRKAAAIRSHLESCWQCRSRLDDLEAGIADYMRYEQSVLTPLLPAPPFPWTDLGRRMEELDATAAIRPSLRGGRIATWLAAAAVVLVALLVFRRLDRAPSVSAATLLRKAAAAEASRPAAKRHIQMRTKHRTVEVKELFEQARFNWDNPLSVEAYRAWRDQLSEKQDDVKTTPTGFVIHTATTANVLRDATLTLRATDLEAVSERLEFEPGDWIEISEAVEQPVASSITSPKEHSETPVIGERTIAGPREELQVTAALHRIGADLGEPIEVTRHGSKLVVAAMGLGTRRQSQVRIAVANIPGVEVRFDQPELMTSPPGDTVQPRRNASGALSALQLQIQNRLGDPGSVEELTNRVLDASEAAMARAYALRALARRFLPETESQLSAEDQNVLASVRRDHLNAMSARVREIDTLLQPALTDLAPSRDAPPAPEPGADWQTQAQQIFASMQRVDHLLSAMLAGGESGVSGQSPGELATALRLVQTQLAQNR